LRHHGGTEHPAVRTDAVGLLADARHDGEVLEKTKGQSSIKLAKYWGEKKRTLIHKDGEVLERKQKDNHL
jgi:hypothetical protein